MIELTDAPIDVSHYLQFVEDGSTGGVVFFIGRVRDHSRGRKVSRMHYEAYPEMARREMQKIADKVKEKWPVVRLVIVHRFGELAVGEASVFIAVACAHRAQAFEACQYAIDTIKTTVPIWKKEFGPDGASWVEGNIPKPEIE